jgi:hypothetical protein
MRASEVRRINRLRILEGRATDHHKRTMREGYTAGALRAANLMSLIENAMLGLGTVKTYSDFD